MKQAVLRALYKWVTKYLQTFPSYSMSLFAGKCATIVRIVEQIPNVQFETPTKVVEGDFEFYFVQTAMVRLSKEEHISISWRLQDDGDEPYPVVEMIKHVHFNKDSRDGIGQIGIVLIYPAQIPNLLNYFKILSNHESNFTLKPRSTEHFVSGPKLRDP